MSAQQKSFIPHVPDPLPQRWKDIRDYSLGENGREKLSVAQIAKKVHLSPRQVGRIRIAMGIKFGERGTPIPADVLARAKRMLEEDEASYAEVGRTLGISDKTIGRKFPGYGWTSQQAGSFRSTMYHISDNAKAPVHDLLLLKREPGVLTDGA